MTYRITQSVLHRITHAQLRSMLDQIFNELAKPQQAQQPCALPPDDAENVKEYLQPPTPAAAITGLKKTQPTGCVFPVFCHLNYARRMMWRCPADA